MSGDIESLLRTGLAEVADAMPAYDDPGLADAAIAGAGRIRRRRRVGAAASGAGLLVLGAATFAWHPWAGPGTPDDGVIAGDTSTSQAQTEFDMEFVVESASAGYQVYTEDDMYVRIGDENPEAVSSLAEGYLVETAGAVTVYGADGGVGEPYAMSEEGYTSVNTGGSQFAIVSPTEDYSAEEYQLMNVLIEGGESPAVFTTNILLTLTDWNDSTAIFQTDLWSVTGGSTSDAYLFNEDENLGLETVAAAGFESVVLTDYSEPDYICVADLDPEAGTSGATESCGYADDPDLTAVLAAAAVDEAAPELLTQSVERATSIDDSVMSDESNPVLDEFYSNTAEMWFDPQGRWEISGERGASTWQLLDLSGDEPTVTELALPDGAIMPVYGHP